VWLRRRGFKRAAVVGWSLGTKKRWPEMEARARWPFSNFFLLFFLVLACYYLAQFSFCAKKREEMICFLSFRIYLSDLMSL
jgi:hypothetical protein